jgi:uncharacterized protein YgiM (DUF1202 family)
LKTDTEQASLINHKEITMILKGRNSLVAFLVAVISACPTSAQEGLRPIADKVDTEGSANEPGSATVVDPDGWTNLRANASTESKIKGRVMAGTEVDIIYKVGKWHLVKTPSGLTGLIHGSRLFDPIVHKMLAPNAKQ